MLPDVGVRSNQKSASDISGHKFNKQSTPIRSAVYLVARRAAACECSGRPAGGFSSLLSLEPPAASGQSTADGRRRDSTGGGGLALASPAALARRRAVE